MHALNGFIYWCIIIANKKARNIIDYIVPVH